MRLRWDTIRVEESTFLPGRLSLHRLPAERRCGVRYLGIGAAPGLGGDKGRSAQDRARESASLWPKANKSMTNLLLSWPVCAVSGQAKTPRIAERSTLTTALLYTIALPEMEL